MRGILRRLALNVRIWRSRRAFLRGLNLKPQRITVTTVAPAGSLMRYEAGARLADMLASGEHDGECLSRQAARLVWQTKYPNYCRSCEGVGGFDIPMHVYRDGSADPPDFDICSCVEEGRCPRCGADDLDTEDGPTACAACGWYWGEGAEDVAPHGECYCEEARLYADYARRATEEGGE